MNKKASAIVLSIILIFMVSGCSAAKSPKDLMKRPISSSNKEFDDIISKFLAPDKTLTLAAGQKNMESIQKVDLDEDGSDEILLLYKDTKDRDKYGVMILKEKKNEWYEINRIVVSAKSIDALEYSDISGDGRPELFIGINSGEDNKKSLLIFTYHGGYFEELYLNKYVDFENYIEHSYYINFGICDLDNDNMGELFLLSQLPEDNVKALRVFKYSDRELLKAAEFNINNLTSSNIVTYGPANEKQNGIFIDFYFENGGGYTDLFVLKDNKIIEVLENETGNENKTYKLNRIDSRDINNDNIIEIGCLRQLQYVEEISKYDTPWINLWYQWDGKKGLNLTKREYYNYDMSFKIHVPDKWGSMFTMKKYYDENIIENKVEFYGVNKEYELDKLFLSIKKYDKEEWSEELKKSDNDKYVILIENEEEVIAAEIFNDNVPERYLITKEELIEMFQTLN